MLNDLQLIVCLNTTSAIFCCHQNWPSRDPYEVPVMQAMHATHVRPSVQVVLWRASKCSSLADLLEVSPDEHRTLCTACHMHSVCEHLIMRRDNQQLVARHDSWVCLMTMAVIVAHGQGCWGAAAAHQLCSKLPSSLKREPSIAPSELTDRCSKACAWSPARNFGHSGLC